MLGFQVSIAKNTTEKLSDRNQKCRTLRETETEIFGRVVKTAFYISRGIFWEQQKFFRNLSKVSARLSKQYSTCPEERFGENKFLGKK